MIPRSAEFDKKYIYIYTHTHTHIYMYMYSWHFVQSKHPWTTSRKLCERVRVRALWSGG